MTKKGTLPRLERTTFRTRRLLDFFSEKELTAQVDYPPARWPEVALKELMDNALDAAEEAGVPPEIAVTVNEKGVTVTDNGRGLPADAIAGVVDFSVRVSSKAAYVSPTRGLQGIALKTIVAMPLALGAGQSRVEVSARGVRHEILCHVDRIEQGPIITRERHQAADVKTGTRIRLEWPASSSLLLKEARAGFLQMAAAFTFLNPHLTLTVDWFGEKARTIATTAEWPHWVPSDPTSPHWYRVEDVERLIAAYIKHDAGCRKRRTVREFVAEFRGLSGSAKGKAVCEDAGLARATLADLVDGQELDRERLGLLLRAMQAHSRPVRPMGLGIIGEDHLRARLAPMGEVDSFTYAKKAGETDGVPWIVEAAFAWRGNYTMRRFLGAGINWSPGITHPFRELGRAGNLDALLTEQEASAWDPVVLVVHVACPRPQYADRGKSAVSIVDRALGQALADAVTSVTRRWAREEKRDERAGLAREAFRRRLLALQHVSCRIAAPDIIPEAYHKASANNTLPARNRQIYYPARDPFEKRTGKPLSADYFTQTVLPTFMREHPDLTADWDVVADARGSAEEPHTGRVVPLGTVEVREYLEQAERHEVGVPQLGVAGRTPFPTVGPQHRFGAILFVEKEGFKPLFERVRLRERYDLEMTSSKGMSIVAARQLVDDLCGKHGIPLLVLRDFDKTGFSIVATLREDTPRYEFAHRIEVIDLGLRLEDARAEGLEAEDITYNKREGDPRPNLRKNGATEEEVQFLCSTVTPDPSKGKPVYSGQRVELNAFTSDRLVAWIERKLAEHGVRKVVPDAKTLKAAFRRSWEVKLRLAQDKAFAEQARRKARAAKVPKGLARLVRQRLKADPAVPWDQAVAELAAQAVSRKAPKGPGDPA